MSSGESRKASQHTAHCGMFVLLDTIPNILLPALLVLSLRIEVRSEGSYLVDPASSHMLVSKIKPCMSKYKLLIL